MPAQHVLIHQAHSPDIPAHQNILNSSPAGEPTPPSPTRSMLIRSISRTKSPILHRLLKTLTLTAPIPGTTQRRQYHDGRPRGPLWRGKKLIGKEALFAISGLKRFKEDDEKAELFVRSHVLRLLKMDLIAVLTELERQEEVELVLKVFKVIQKQDWYKPDPYLYKDLIIALSRCKKMEEVAKMWEDMKKEELFPDSQTYTEVIRGYLKYGSRSDAMNIYEDMLKSPDPPDELPFKVLLRGLLPHPLLRNKVKKDYEEIFPESRVYDPPSEIFSFAESNA